MVHHQTVEVLINTYEEAHAVWAPHLSGMVMVCPVASPFNRSVETPVEFRYISRRVEGTDPLNITEYTAEVNAMEPAILETTHRK